MINQGKAHRGPRDPFVSLDGEQVILRKASVGYTVELTRLDRVGERISGYFVPASPNKGTHGWRAPAETASRTGERSIEDVPETPRLEDLREREVLRWMEIRERFLRKHRSVTAPELAELTGSRSRNPPSRAHEWMRSGKVFAVHDGGTARYPLFQIDEREGVPRPEVRDALGYLREKLSDWQIAIWFVTANAWTGDWRCPVDLLGREPKRVVDVAQNEVAEQVL